MSLLVRALPLPRLGGRRAMRLVERNLLLYRRIWFVLASGFFEPLFYLFGIGLGLGGLVGDMPGPDGRPISYAAFVAPALLATSAMNGALFEATFNFFSKLRWDRVFEGILATPLGIGDLALGELAWSNIRSSLYSAGFLAVIVLMGLAPSPLVVLALPAAALLGLAVGAVGMAATTWMRDWTDFDLITVVIMPVFLFSGTFFPVSALPAPAAALVWLSPLFHGTELIRSLALGSVGPLIVVHVAYLAALALVGLTICSRRLTVLLSK